MKLQNLKAFTLVELSIVLVIIGLLTAGVVGGQSLIKSAQLQKVATTFTGFQTAQRAYQLEYDALPGDHSTASSYWSVTNGNGNGQFGDAATGWANELVYYWSHLNSANLLDKSLIDSSSAIGSTPMPTSKFTSSGTVTGRAGFFITTGDNYGMTELANKNAMSFAALSGQADYTVLTPKDAKSIDAKLDDGIPRTGKVISGGRGVTYTTCVKAADSTYDVSLTAIGCRMFYQMD